MESYGIRVGPKSKMASVLRRRKKLTHKEEGHVKTEAETDIMGP